MKDEPEHQVPLQVIDSEIERPHHWGEQALGLLDKIFPYFNSTQPEITESCWLS